MQGLEPLHEGDYRLLMHPYGVIGVLAGVQSIYDLCILVLRQEPGIDTNPMKVAMVERLTAPARTRVASPLFGTTDTSRERDLTTH